MLHDLFQTPDAASRTSRHHASFRATTTCLGNFLKKFSAIISKEEGRGSSYLYVLGESTEERQRSPQRTGICCKMESGACIPRPHVFMVCLFHFPRSSPCQ
jgi:hypothetical protein